MMSSVSRSPSFTPPAAVPAAAGYRELTQQEVERLESALPPERMSIWISAILLVAFCSVFWVGTITIGRWIFSAAAAVFT